MEVDTPRKWAMLVNAVSISHLLLILLAGLLSSLAGFTTLDWLMQLMGVQSLLMIIEGLTRDEGQSILSKVCKMRVTQELGRMSLTLYLTHLVVR